MDVVVYGQYYNQAMQGIEDMLFQAGSPMISFKKDKYPEGFQAYLRKYIEVIDAIEKVYEMEEKPQEWLEKLAEHLVNAAGEELDRIPKKGKRSEKLIDFNMTLAVFLFPAILEQKGQSAEPLTDLIVEKWNEAFKTSVGKASYEKIESGFHRKLCYITTAVCESQGKPDDCYELQLLRDYRDHYLLSTEEGEALVREYYNIAPTIVNRIGRLTDSQAIYEEIWRAYLSPCVQMIEKGDEEGCKGLYMDMVYDLKGRYMA
ncbi:MAG: hypothetical protein HFJ10_14230 [Lachnospiraceae bacterium]|nr:hypothetical protein [Lachnospiraceae bacterium]